MEVFAEAEPNLNTGNYVQMRFEPICAISGFPRPVAYEALLDPSGTEFESPIAMLDEAALEGSDARVELELSAISAAIETFGHCISSLDQRPALFVNASVILLNSAYRSRLLTILRGANHEVTLEITEDAFKISDRELARGVNQLRCLGVKIAIDDFGRGASNIDRVFLVKPDFIKIDRLFSMENERADAVLNYCKENLANEANLILEGVESEVQLNRAKQLGIKLAQGYLFSSDIG